MDQIAALLCRAGQALLLDCRHGTGTEVPLDPAAAGLTLLVIDTRARHALGDGRYAERRRACAQAASALGVRALRDITDVRELAGLADPSLKRLSGHVVAEHRRVLDAAGLLRAGDQAAVGTLLTASHHSLRDNFQMSWPQADHAVEAAIEAGAAGARMTGGGFGGCVVALAPAERATQVRAAVTGRFAAPPLAGPALPGRDALRRRPPPALNPAEVGGAVMSPAAWLAAVAELSLPYCTGSTVRPGFAHWSVIWPLAFGGSGVPHSGGERFLRSIGLHVDAIGQFVLVAGPGCSLEAVLGGGGGPVNILRFAVRPVMLAVLFLLTGVVAQVKPAAYAVGPDPRAWRLLSPSAVLFPMWPPRPPVMPGRSAPPAAGR